MKEFFFAVFLKDFDMFGAEVPGLNLRGQSKIKTSPGACISIIIMCLTTIFSLIRLQHMLVRKNPAVVIIKQPDVFDATERYNIADEDFMFAVSLEHWTDGPKMDLRYF